LPSSPRENIKKVTSSASLALQASWQLESPRFLRRLF
jgi:hypothetical protein